MYVYVHHRGGTARRFRTVGVAGVVAAFSLAGAFLAFVLAMIEEAVPATVLYGGALVIAALVMNAAAPATAAGDVQ